ncbi:MAG: hypothetical protein Q8755_02675 [Candidatus Phytoplasma australasiaticum]|nr:hypothetical protein [Candidatus Phytoplasma australasiaticum]
MAQSGGGSSSGKFVCADCSIHYISAEDLRKHRRGKKHQTRKQAVLEMNDNDDDDDDDDEEEEEEEEEEEQQQQEEVEAAPAHDGDYPCIRCKQHCDGTFMVPCCETCFKVFNT